MTPYEVEEYIEREYVAPIQNHRQFYQDVASHLTSYEVFADFTYSFVDAQTQRLEDSDDDFQKIGYVKARVATFLWPAYGGSFGDIGYLRAVRTILDKCRLTDQTREKLQRALTLGERMPAPSTVRDDLADACAYAFRTLSAGNSATSATSATLENTMNNASNTAAFATVSYVYGRPVNSLNEAELIGAIKGVEAEIKELGKIESSSTKIAAKIDELKAMLASIVEALDASK